MFYSGAVSSLVVAAAGSVSLAKLSASNTKTGIHRGAQICACFAITLSIPPTYEISVFMDSKHCVPMSNRLTGRQKMHILQQATDTLRCFSYDMLFVHPLVRLTQTTKTTYQDTNHSISPITFQLGVRPRLLQC